MEDAGDARGYSRLDAGESGKKRRAKFRALRLRPTGAFVREPRRNGKPLGLERIFQRRGTRSQALRRRRPRGRSSPSRPSLHPQKPLDPAGLPTQFGLRRPVVDELARQRVQDKAPPGAASRVVSLAHPLPQDRRRLLLVIFDDLLETLLRQTPRIACEILDQADLALRSPAAELRTRLVAARAPRRSPARRSRRSRR